MLDNFFAETDACTDGANPLFEQAGLAGDMDGACIAMNGSGAVSNFLNHAKTLRYWKREAAMKM